MPESITILPSRVPGLLVSPLGRDGQYVVKDLRNGAYFHLGEQEQFLFDRLDGTESIEAIQAAFEGRFGEPLSAADLQEFLEIVERRGLLESSPDGLNNDDSGATVPTPASTASATPRQSILYWRRSLFDPDRLFNLLEPKLRFVWTRTFLVASAAGILAAGFLAWSNRMELVSNFPQSIRWETLVLVWLTVTIATTCHEFAHGLTCKHYGGEVHEVGVLLMFFTPCLFCNVSDAWLIPEKSKRLWVTLAGGYCDLCIWAVATFVWRLTMRDSLINYLAWIALSVCGARMFFNFNPLMRLDGYYLLGDLLEIPNLRRRAREFWTAHVRRILWGAQPPEATPRAKTLAIYGIASWVFSMALLAVLFAGFFRYFESHWGIVGAGSMVLLVILVLRKLFRGFTRGEVHAMITTRPKRTKLWLLGLAALGAVLLVGRMDDRAGGSFQVRPGTRIEIRAEVAGFLEEINGDEGDHVSKGAAIARLQVPDLASQIAQKQAQVRESQANLRRLEAGPRAEEVAEQRLRVQRTRAWRDMGRLDLARAREGLRQDLTRLEQQIAQFAAEMEFANQTLAESEKLIRQGALSGEQYRAEKKTSQVAESQWEQARSQKKVREATGTLEAEAELARREKELADAQAALGLLEAGTRPEEIDAERARLARLQEELHYVEQTQAKLRVASPVAGTITTPRMKEKIGQYLEKGALICVVEDISGVDAEIALSEEDVEGVQPGDRVELKARSLPFRTFTATVDRVAPSATSGPNDLKSTVTVYCHVDNADAALRSGMTGCGRIYRGSQPIGLVMAGRALRLFRTEFWW